MFDTVLKEDVTEADLEIICRQQRSQAKRVRGRVACVQRGGVPHALENNASLSYEIQIWHGKGSVCGVVSTMPRDSLALSLFRSPSGWEVLELFGHVFYVT